MGKREHSFVRKMMEYAERSSRNNLEREAETFKNIEETYAFRIKRFQQLRRYTETFLFRHCGRKISKVKLLENEIVLGTVDGCVCRIAVPNAYGKLEKMVAENNLPLLETEKICDFAIQNIFYDGEPIFMAKDGCVHFPPAVYTIGALVQQSDYHCGLGLLLATDECGNIFAHDLKAQKPVFKNKIRECTSIQIHEDGNVFLCSNGAACFVDIRSMKTVVRLGRDVTVSVFQNSHVICAASDNMLQAFDLRTLNSIGHVLSHKTRVHFLEESNEIVYSGSMCGEVCISSPSLSMIHKELCLESVENLDVRNGRMIVCTEGNTLRLLDA
eukprot:jgi/Antlo1/1976/148